MKTILLASLLMILSVEARAFVVPMTLEEKCRKADAILQITVQKVEPVELTEGMAWQFHALARCKVVSSFKGKKDWKGKFIFIPCDYHFDESPCDIEAGKNYVVFLETMGNFSQFGHPIGPLCCHHVVDGKVSTGVSGKELVSVDEFARLITEVLIKPVRASPKNPE